MFLKPEGARNLHGFGTVPVAGGFLRRGLSSRTSQRRARHLSLSFVSQSRRPPKLVPPKAEAQRLRRQRRSVAKRNEELSEEYGRKIGDRRWGLSRARGGCRRRRACVIRAPSRSGLARCHLSSTFDRIRPPPCDGPPAARARPTRAPRRRPGAVARAPRRLSYAPAWRRAI